LDVNLIFAHKLAWLFVFKTTMKKQQKEILICAVECKIIYRKITNALLTLLWYTNCQNARFIWIAWRM